MSKKNYPALVLKISSLVLIGALIILSVLTAILLIKYPFNESYVWILYPLVGLGYIVFFFSVIASYYFYKLMHEVEISKVVTHKTLYFLRRVKLQILRCLVVFLMMIPFVYALSDMDDSPGLLIILLGVIASTGMYYMLMDVFYRLFHDAQTAQRI